MKGHADLFVKNSDRLAYDEAIDLTLASMQAYGPSHDHWAIAFSGGKDSSATVTLIAHLIDVGLPRAHRAEHLAEWLGRNRACSRHPHDRRLSRRLPSVLADLRHPMVIHSGGGR